MQAQQLIDDFAHHPVEVAAEWRSKTVATRMPQVGEHEEWHLAVELSCPEVPILLALVLRDGQAGMYSRLHRSNADHEAVLRLSFFPFAWFESDAVRVSLYQSGGSYSAGADLLITNRVFKSAPRLALDVPGLPSADALTGSVCRLATSPSTGFTADVIILSKADTENVRGRWRVRRSLVPALPEALRFLAEGTSSGQLAHG